MNNLYRIPRLWTTPCGRCTFMCADPSNITLKVQPYTDGRVEGICGRCTFRVKQNNLKYNLYMPIFLYKWFFKIHILKGCVEKHESYVKYLDLEILNCGFKILLPQLLAGFVIWGNVLIPQSNLLRADIIIRRSTAKSPPPSPSFCDLVSTHGDKRREPSQNHKARHHILTKSLTEIHKKKKGE